MVDDDITVTVTEYNMPISLDAFYTLILVLCLSVSLSLSLSVCLSICLSLCLSLSLSLRGFSSISYKRKELFSYKWEGGRYTENFNDKVDQSLVDGIVQTAVLLGRQQKLFLRWNLQCLESVLFLWLYGYCSIFFFNFLEFSEFTTSSIYS